MLFCAVNLPPFLTSIRYTEVDITLAAVYAIRMMIKKEDAKQSFHSFYLVEWESKRPIKLMLTTFEDVDML